MTAEYAATIAPPRADRHEQARQDRLVRAQIERDREAARTQAHIAEREASARIKRDEAAARAAARDERSARLAKLAGWVSGHIMDLLFVPVIGVPALLSWTAMAAFGMLLYGPAGAVLPSFSEGSMWAFAGAVTITLNRYPGRPVWHLRTGIGVFAVFGAALNYLHGSSMVHLPGMPPGPFTGGIMAAISVAGVIAHQLITAGPRGKDNPAEDDPRPVTIEAAPVVDEPDTAPVIEADASAATDADSGPAIEAAPTPDTGTDSPADTNPAPKRPAPRTRRGPSTATRVARMRDKHPGETPADIAARLSLSARTVRRYWTGEPEASAA
jgi:hypothetical protein